MKRFEDLVDAIAAQERVPGVVGQALVDTENEPRSAGTIREEGYGGAHGLTQITLTTARGLGFRGTSDQLNEPEINLRYGLRYLRAMYDQVGRGDWIRAYAGYNAGPDLSPWPTAHVARFQKKLDIWIAQRRPPGFLQAPAPTSQAATGGRIQMFLVWGLVFTVLLSLVKGKR
ncbi:MAG: transglycosylase SLT domain-containing protein [Burkholderiales bacterium]